MCGIFAYTGTKRAAPLLIDGLKTLEYRGYDSAGIFIPGNAVVKTAGAVEVLAEKMPKHMEGTAGIAHTRWATHGLPVEDNAHPHTAGSVVLVHNGIIENYAELKRVLKEQGHVFSTDTDTEVLAHLIEEKLKTHEELSRAVTVALNEVEGTYGIAVMRDEEPDTIVIARMGSPIALGVGSGEYVVASDAAPIVRHTRTIIYLNDGECAVVRPAGYDIFTLAYERREPTPERVDWDIEEVKKQGHAHFMLKEIMEAPEVLLNSARGRLDEHSGDAHLGGIAQHADDLRAIDRLILVGCGSAYYAGLVGKLMIEEMAGIPVDVELGSEFRYRRLITQGATALLAISQSGETADTLASLREAKRKGMLTLGVVNVVGSTIARETDAGVYNHAGPEIGVASTKAFLSQLEVLALLALYLGRQRELSRSDGAAFVRSIASLPAVVETILTHRAHIEALAQRYAAHEDMLYIGRKYNFASAYEGALKIKEVSYLHAEGYGAGEMKHGPIAMIDERFPTVAIAPRDSVYEKMVSNIEEIKARSGRVLALVTEGDKQLAELADDVIEIPPVDERLSPIACAVPLQLFAYYVGVARGYNVDRPRNLAKSVTVE